MPLDDVALAGRQKGTGVALNPNQKLAQDYYRAQYEPQLAYIDYQGVQAQNKMGQFYAQKQLAQSQGGQNSNFANQDYALGMDRLGLQRSGLGIDANYYQALLGKQGLLTDLANQLYGFNTQEITNQAQGATRNQISQSVAAGSLQAKNTVANLADIITQRDIGLGKAKNALDSTLNSLDERRLGLQRSADLNANQLKQLDITAKELGLSRDKALAAISQGLARMNLNSVIGAQDLFDAMQSNDYQRQAIANQITMEATRGYEMGLFGYPSPATYSGTPAGTSTSSSAGKSRTNASRNQARQRQSNSSTQVAPQYQRSGGLRSGTVK